jgi:hypothetical protein
MKLLVLLAVGVFTALGINSCTKNELTPSPTSTPPPTNNIPLRVYAIPEVWMIPTDTCMLSGSASHAPNKVVVERYWRKISGPSIYVLETPNSFQTRIRNVEKGTYGFELTVIDNDGRVAKDTTIVLVRDAPIPGAGEVLFRDLPWTCPMGCTLNIDCFSCFIPAGRPFKVFLQRDGATIWTEVKHVSLWTSSEKYVYSLDNNHLSIYTEAPEWMETPDIKITF